MFGSSVVDGTGQIILDNLQCTGTESRLVNCRHNGLGNHNCDHSEDAGVRCRPGIIIQCCVHTTRLRSLAYSQPSFNYLYVEKFREPGFEAVDTLIPYRYIMIIFYFSS